jgi:hypothetical protein
MQFNFSVHYFQKLALIKRGGGTGPMMPGNLPFTGVVPIPAA